MERLAFYRMQVAKLRAKKVAALALALLNKAARQDVVPEARADYLNRAIKHLMADALGNAPQRHVANARAASRELRANLIALRRFEAEAKKQADEKAKEDAA